MISQTAEYALRSVVTLAAQDGATMTARQLADACGVPQGYMAKVLQSLARAGIVESRRGLHGGFTLSRAPADLTVYDVVQAVDPLQRIKACPLGLPEHADDLCPLHQRLDVAMETVETMFRRSTVAEMMAGAVPARLPADPAGLPGGAAPPADPQQGAGRGSPEPGRRD